MKRVNLLSQRIGLFFIILLTSAACDRAIQPQDSGQKSGTRIRFNQTITEVVVANPAFSLVKAAVVKAGLANALVTGNLTVFTLTNATFQAVGFLTIESIQLADRAILTRILTYHVVAGCELSSTLRSGEVNTLQGRTVLVAVAPNQAITIKGNSNATPSNVTAGDIVTRNGIVHVIDQVLLP